jgi:esterase
MAGRRTGATRQRHRHDDRLRVTQARQHAEPVSRYVEVNGLRLHYLEWGSPDAKPVLLLHGLRGHAHSWDDVSSALAPDFRVLALDQRGRGNSSWAADASYSTESFVADLDAFCSTLKLNSLVLVGHSMGGRNGILFTSKNPKRVAAFAIVDVGPDIQPDGAARIKKEIVDAPEAFESLDAAVKHACAENPLAAEAVLRRRVQYQTKPAPEGKVIWRYDPVIREQVRSNTRPAPPDFWALWGSITCPTLVIRGAQTDTLAKAVAQRMVAAHPRGQLVEIPQAAHMVFEDNPTGFTIALRHWLEGITT